MPQHAATFARDTAKAAPKAASPRTADSARTAAPDRAAAPRPYGPAPTAPPARLWREADGPGPTHAPAIVSGVVSGPGREMPGGLRDEMEATLDTDLADVRLHTDERASRSAEAVGAAAYTVGRHVVFGAGRFEPGTTAGRQLIAHELAHAAQHPAGSPTPGGGLRLSDPAEPAERHAGAVAAGTATAGAAPAAPAAVFRQNVALNGATINETRVTSPPEAGLSFRARPDPTNANNVTFSFESPNTTIHSGTTIANNGTITVDPMQEGGEAQVRLDQTLTMPDGGTQTAFATTPSFAFIPTPDSISSTSAVSAPSAGGYGGDFTHTFDAHAGPQAPLSRARVNERFAAATGTNLVLSSPFGGNLRVRVNPPNSKTAGWVLDSTGTMPSPDHVTWGPARRISVRPFLATASNPTPADTLPQEITATQNFRNLNHPSETYSGTVASTVHRRAMELRNDTITAVTSANAPGINEEVEQDYAGPFVIRGLEADPSSIPATPPPDPAAPDAATPTTSTISATTEGAAAAITFSVRDPNLGCTIDASTGVLTPGTEAGTVTVRAADSASASYFDETDVTITAPPTPEPEDGDGTEDGADPAPEAPAPSTPEPPSDGPAEAPAEPAPATPEPAPETRPVT
ncbi:MAG: DUF4157 domain-containing protein [Pseudomonadota bacterium]